MAVGRAADAGHLHQGQGLLRRVVVGPQVVVVGYRVVVVARLSCAPAGVHKDWVYPGKVSVVADGRDAVSGSLDPKERHGLAHLGLVVVAQTGYLRLVGCACPLLEQGYGSC
jgi:hypothetical protein